MLCPKEFGKICIQPKLTIPTPKLLYIGNITDEIVTHVKNRTVPGMTFEGVVCKARLHPKHPVTMFKIKSNDWLNKLKNYCGDNNQLFKELE